MSEYKKVKEIISSFINFEVGDVYIFGSRAKGTQRIDSDLDILIVDKIKIAPEIITRLEEAFEESSLPFKVDIVLKSRIDESFYNKIKPDLINLNLFD